MDNALPDLPLLQAPSILSIVNDASTRRIRHMHIIKSSLMQSKISNFLSISKIDTFLNSKLVINIRPSWDESVILPTLIKKAGLNSNTRLGIREFRAIFYSLLFLRVSSENHELRLSVENILRSATIPAGFQKIIKYLPSGGSMYRIKDHYLEFTLDKKIISYVSESYYDGSLARNIGEMSRHLNSTSNARRESFNPNFLNSGSRYFICNSYFQKNYTGSSRADLEFNIDSRTPGIDIGTSLALIFGFTCEDDLDLRLLLGVVASTTMQPGDYDVNVINSFEFLLSDKSLDPSSGATFNNSLNDNSNSDSKQNEKPSFGYRSLLHNRDVVDNLEDKPLKSLGFERALEKIIRKILNKIILEVNQDDSVSVQST